MTQLDKWNADHRPWQLPTSPWVMRQSWNNLLLVHYPIAIDILKELVPKALPLDTYDGVGWISFVPFKMNNIGLRGIPLSVHFPELNVRTYVTINNKPGVFFFSLDATNLPVILLCKSLAKLPYLHADMSMQQQGEQTHFSCQRKNDSDIIFNCTYEPASEPYYPEKDSHDHWLMERYCFYTMNAAGNVYRCEIHHEPWPIQQVKATIHNNTHPITKHFATYTDQPIMHYSKGVDVRTWPLTRVRIND